MKKISLLLLLLVASCADTKDPLEGEWEVRSRFFKARYEILKEDNQLKALVLFYDDGTTVYNYDGTKRHYAYQNLRKKEDIYVDVVSGATKHKESDTMTDHIRMIGNDSLQMITYMMNKPIIDVWVRKQRTQTEKP